MDSRCEITSVFTEEQGTLPVLVEFENGKINPNQSQNLQCKLYRDPNNVNSKIVSITNDNTHYVGSTDPEKKPYQTYLGIHNRRTKQVQLVQVESLRAAPLLEKGLLPDDPSDLDGPEQKDAQKAFLNLSRVFGSKIQRRLQEQKLRFKVEAKTDDELKEIVKDKAVEVEDTVIAPDNSFTDLLPPRNTEALYPTDVYDINDILKEEEIDNLKTVYADMSKEEDFLSKCSPFFKSLKDVCDEDEKKLALLLYAEYLIQLCNKTVVGDLFQVCDASEAVAKRMAKEFTSSRGKSRKVHAAHRDKAILRVIIISFYVAKFKANLSVLNDSLREVNLTRLKLLARITGATLADSNSQVAILKVPLPEFSATSGSFKKGKRR